MQNVIGETVIYYGVSLQESEVKRLYGEAINKVTTEPVKLFALVYYENQNTTSTKFGSDSQYTIEVFLHTEELNDRNLKPKEGDFIEYDQKFFEIASATQSQLVYGQVNNKVMTKCVCVYSREGQFQFGADSSKDKDNSHPIENDQAVDE